MWVLTSATRTVAAHHQLNLSPNAEGGGLIYHKLHGTIDFAQHKSLRIIPHVDEETLVLVVQKVGAALIALHRLRNPLLQLELGRRQMSIQDRGSETLLC